MFSRIKYNDFVDSYSPIYKQAKHYPEVLKKSKKGWNTQKISEYFKIPYQTIWKWKNRKSTPVPFVEYVKIKKQFSKEEIKNLAPVIGYIFGDGGILSNGVIYYCNTEFFLIKEFTSSMNKVFDEKPSIREEKNVTRIKYPSKIGKSLWCIFGKFSSGKDTKIITKQIKEMPLKWKIKMLQTWFNDDGSVPKYKVIAIKQKLKPLIDFIQKILSELDISSQVSEDGGRWHLRICGYKNMIKFKEKIDFSKNYRKSQRLNEVIESIKYPHSVTKDKILNLLNDSPKTRKDLQKLLSIKEGTIYGHLHGWKRKTKYKKTTIGLIDLGIVKIKKQEGINIYFT